jgi:hypothetical protein
MVKFIYTGGASPTVISWLGKGAASATAARHSPLSQVV